MGKNNGLPVTYYYDTVASRSDNSSYEYYQELCKGTSQPGEAVYNRHQRNQIYINYFNTYGISESKEKEDSTCER